MTTTTYPIATITDPDPGVLAGFEAGNGLAPGDLEPLLAVNPTGSADALGAPNGNGYDLVSLGTAGYLLGVLGFGAIPAPVAPTGYEVVVTLAPTGVPYPAAGFGFSILFMNAAGDGVSAVFEATPAMFGSDGGTFVLTTTAPIADLTAAIAGGGGSVDAYLYISGDPAGYLPSFDSIQLRVTTPAVGGTVSNNAHAETANCMLIAVELDAKCEIMAGAAVYVTAGVGKITPTVVREDGTDYSVPNFGGVTCGPDQKGQTQEKSVDLEGEFCLVNWAFMAMTSGNPKIIDADGNVIGYQQLKRVQSACDPTNRPRIALTIIRKSATGDGGCVSDSTTTGAQGAVAHTYPNTTDWVWDIPPYEDARAIVPFKAKAYTAPNPGRGPLNLYPEGATPATISPDAFYTPYFVPFADLPSIDDNVTAAHPAPLGKL